MNKKVLLIDIDGTITSQKSESWGSNLVLPGTVEKVNGWKQAGYEIIFWTGRSWDDFNVTKSMLDDAGFEYDDLICGKPVSDNIVIIDDKPISVRTIKRNEGIDDIEI